MLEQLLVGQRCEALFGNQLPNTAEGGALCVGHVTILMGKVGCLQHDDSGMRRGFPAKFVGVEARNGPPLQCRKKSIAPSLSRDRRQGQCGGPAPAV